MCGHLPKGIGWLALFGIGLIFFGHGTLGLFLVRVGRAVLLEAEIIGYVMMAGAVVGILCPLLAGYIGSRSAPGLPVLVIVSILLGDGPGVVGCRQHPGVSFSPRHCSRRCPRH